MPGDVGLQVVRQLLVQLENTGLGFLFIYLFIFMKYFFSFY